MRIHTEGRETADDRGAAVDGSVPSQCDVTRVAVYWRHERPPGGRPRGQAAGIVSMRMGECGVLVVHAPSLAEGEASRSVVCTACACGNSTG